MFWVSDLEQIPFLESFNLQRSLREKRLENQIPNLLLLTSHPPVFTLGRRDCREDFLSLPDEIKREGIEVIATNRGGRVTYHGPGQIVGYFIADIRELKLSIPEFVHRVEEILIRTLKTFGLSSHRDLNHPGVWIADKKIAAIGLHFDRGVSMHGFALNVNPNLNHYRHIIACGIRDRRVSSMEMELKQEIDLRKVQEEIKKNVEIVFYEKGEWVEKEKILFA